MTKPLTILEAQTKNYWLASRKLLRGDVSVSGKVAARHLASLARHCCHARLRCAAGGALVSLGLSGLNLDRSDISALPINEPAGSQSGYGYCHNDDYQPRVALADALPKQHSR